LTKKLVKPEYLNSSVGAVLKYSFDTEKELEEFFLQCLASFQKTKVKTKVIGKSIYIFRNKSETKEETNVANTSN
jgi:hypothetical protein